VCREVRFVWPNPISNVYISTVSFKKLHITAASTTNDLRFAVRAFQEGHGHHCNPPPSGNRVSGPLGQEAGKAL
jgi:hypothetical protein